MAREKQVTKTAKIANEDLGGHLSYKDGELLFRLEINHEDGTMPAVSPVITVSDVLSGAGEYADYLAYTIRLRDAGFDAAGYQEV